MPNSIRNQIQGTIIRISSDKVMSEVILDTPAGEIVSVITTASIKRLKLKKGQHVTALIKATNVSLKDCDCNCDGH
jgi:molybdopterin-binding protein